MIPRTPKAEMATTALRAVGSGAPFSDGATLLLTFPGRRYHATPWGHHVNEGLIEWPPSPWRLLRSFLSTGYAKLQWSKDGPPPVARALIEKLATVLPRYRLPRAIGTHSRHYMPMARFKNRREETTMVLDTWAQIDDGSIGVHWPVILTQDERHLLSDLARELGYLGRSESWVEGKLANDVDPRLFEVVHGEARNRPGPGWEQVALLAPVAPSEYSVWREQSVQTVIDALPEVNSKGKPLKKSDKDKESRKTQATYPSDLIACLQVDTAWLQELGWNQPPGSRKVLYWRPSNSLEGTGAIALPRSVHAADVEFMLLSMSTGSGNLHALPSVTRTLPQGELLHRALLSQSPSGVRPPSVFSGRDAEGTPLRGERAHRHAHLVHLDLDSDGHLDHVLLWAPMGIDAKAQGMVRAVRKTFTKGGIAPLRLAVAAMGSRSDLAALPSPWGDRLRELIGGSTTQSRCWRSITPFVPPRFLKAQGSNAIEGQVRAELRVRGFPEPLRIRQLDPHSNELARKSRHFVRRRGHGSASGGTLPPPVDCGFMFELEFSEKVLGPIVLGYASHFGLGAFAAVEQDAFGIGS